MPLFKMVRSASYDKVLALETSLTTRDITVAEGRFGCLQVTKVNGANIPLREQDWYVSYQSFYHIGNQAVLDEASPHVGKLNSKGKPKRSKQKQAFRSVLLYRLHVSRRKINFQFIRVLSAYASFLLLTTPLSPSL